MKKQYIGWDCLKRGLGQFADLRGSFGKKEEGVMFLRGLIPQCTLCTGYANFDFIR